MQELLNAAEALVLVVDARGNIDECNTFGQRVLGVTAHEMLGKHYEQVGPLCLLTCAHRDENRS